MQRMFESIGLLLTQCLIEFSITLTPVRGISKMGLWRMMLTFQKNCYHSYCMITILQERLIQPSLLILSVCSLIFWGCTQGDTPKKVSLLKRAPAVSAGEEDTKEDVIQFGFNLRLGPKEDVLIYTSFLRYLEETTGKRFRIKFTEKYEDTVENLGKGITGFSAIDSLSYVMGRDRYGDTIAYLASGVNDEGDARYRAVIFVRPESTIETLGDIKNKSFAFGSRISTLGHLIPRKMLEDAGITLEDLSSVTYTGSHINTVRAVLNGEFEAGVIQEGLAVRLVSEGKIKILKRSVAYPSSIIAFNSDMESGIVEEVKSALLEFVPKGRHKHMLIDWEKTEMPLGFTRISESDFYRIAILARKYGLIQQ